MSFPGIPMDLMLALQQQQLQQQQQPPQLGLPPMGPGPGVPSQHPDFAAMYGPGGSQVPPQPAPQMIPPQQPQFVPQAVGEMRGPGGEITGEAAQTVTPEQAAANRAQEIAFKERIQGERKARQEAKKVEVADRKQAIQQKRASKKAFRNDMRQLAKISRLPKAAMNHMLKTREARVLQVLKDQGVEIENIWKIRSMIATDAMKEEAEREKQERELEKIERRTAGDIELEGVRQVGGLELEGVRQAGDVASEEQRIIGRERVKAAPGTPEAPQTTAEYVKEQQEAQERDLRIAALQKKLDSPKTTLLAKRRMQRELDSLEALTEQRRERTEDIRLRREAELGTGAEDELERLLSG